MKCLRSKKRLNGPDYTTCVCVCVCVCAYVYLPPPPFSQMLTSKQNGGKVNSQAIRVYNALGTQREMLYASNRNQDGEKLSL